MAIELGGIGGGGGVGQPVVQAVAPLDIREGDRLVVNGRDYAIRSAAEWAWPGPGSLAMQRQMTLTASTKRRVINRATASGSMESHLTALRCTPLDPARPEVQEQLVSGGPYELLETFVAGPTAFVHLVLEEGKR